jgi:hypothetical protein
MADLTTQRGRELLNIKFDLKTKWYNDSRFTHDKFTELPVLNYHWTNSSYSRKTADDVGRFDSKDDVVQLFKTQLRDGGTYWGEAGRDFWDQKETRVTYHKTTAGRRIRSESAHTRQHWYEQDLEDEIRGAIEKVRVKYQKQFVRHIDDKIQMADKFYAFCRGAE